MLCSLQDARASQSTRIEMVDRYMEKSLNRLLGVVEHSPRPRATNEVSQPTSKYPFNSISSMYFMISLSIFLVCYMDIRM